MSWNRYRGSVVSGLRQQRARGARTEPRTSDSGPWLGRRRGTHRGKQESCWCPLRCRRRLRHRYPSSFVFRPCSVPAPSLGSKKAGIASSSRPLWRKRVPRCSAVLPGCSPIRYCCCCCHRSRPWKPPLPSRFVPPPKPSRARGLLRNFPLRASSRTPTPTSWRQPRARRSFLPDREVLLRIPPLLLPLSLHATSRKKGVSLFLFLSL
mmetsp:Transcript_4215/g.9851  ORF Transcript_4215/g.9851 Transcript_4215/m.9851 type:complete len:208 (-) Transcript_4215:65-688(-)